MSGSSHRCFEVFHIGDNKEIDAKLGISGLIVNREGAKTEASFVVSLRDAIQAIKAPHPTTPTKFQPKVVYFPKKL
ncbi:hypothetical protein HY641_04975 [Candidatus Woesearchaeota archaeon]|nr:hypothetical protein [Candidatus Woesearchaeota archaeon]